MLAAGGQEVIQLDAVERQHLLADSVAREPEQPAQLGHRVDRQHVILSDRPPQHVAQHGQPQRDGVRGPALGQIGEQEIPHPLALQAPERHVPDARDPYKYVSVEGPIVAIEDADVERDLRPLARRYLGLQAGDQHVETTRSEHEDNVLVRMRPERWLTADFAKA